MNEFITKNAVRMVEGELFNWRKDDPFNISISIGSLDRMYVFSYDMKKKILSLFEMSHGSDYCNDFYCEELLDAEKIVMAFAKGNKYKLLPIYEKPEIIITGEPFLNKN